MVENIINNLLTLQQGFKFDDKRSKLAKSIDRSMLYGVLLLLDNLNTSHITIECELPNKGVSENERTLQDLRFFVEYSDGFDSEIREIYGDITSKLIIKLEAFL